MQYNCSGTFLTENGRRYHLDVVAVVGRRKAAYHTILIFFVESGALYCLTWVRIEHASIS